MIHLSRGDLEVIGSRVIKAYQKIAETNHLPQDRVDIDVLVQQLLHLHIEFQHLSKDRSILGATAFEDIGIEVFPEQDEDDGESFYMLDGKTILIESDLTLEGANVGRRNFTVAHEGCHQILNMLFPHDYGKRAPYRAVHYYRGTGSRNDFAWEEWQTDALASVILMPSEYVQHCMQAFGLGSKMRLLNRVFAKADYTRFEEMSTYMGVSKTALSIRMVRLGLLQRNDLGDPYALVRIERTEDDSEL